MKVKCILCVAVIYLSVTMSLGTASVCLTVLVLNLHYRVSLVPVPRWIRHVFLHHVANALGFLSDQTRQPVVVSPLPTASRRHHSSTVDRVQSKQTVATSQVHGETHNGWGADYAGCSSIAAQLPQQLHQQLVDSSQHVEIRPATSANRRRSYQNSVAVAIATTSTMDEVTRLHLPLRTEDSERNNVDADNTSTTADITMVSGRSNSYCRMLAQLDDDDNDSLTFQTTTTSFGIPTLLPHDSPLSPKAAVESKPIVAAEVRCTTFNAEPEVDQFRSTSSTSIESGAIEVSRDDVEVALKEWQMLARVLDRLFFFVVAVLMTASTLFILLTPFYAG